MFYDTFEASGTSSGRVWKPFFLEAWKYDVLAHAWKPLLTHIRSHMHENHMFDITLKPLVARVDMFEKFLLAVSMEIYVSTQIEGHVYRICMNTACFMTLLKPLVTKWTYLETFVLPYAC